MTKHRSELLRIALISEHAFQVQGAALVSANDTGIPHVAAVPELMEPAHA